MSGPSIILGMGSGRCGTRSLAKLLNLQPNTRVTHEEAPRLPWRVPRPGKMVERLTLMRQSRAAPIVGNVASYHLPYIEEAIACDSNLRAVCLKRPRAEVVKSFCKWIDKVHPLPTNHWAARPAPGWHHEPVWSRIFPKYDLQDREAGIGRYWDEYYERAQRLAAQFPANVLIVDWLQALNSEEGQRDVLAFCGYSPSEQVISLDVHENQSETAGVRKAPAHLSTDPNDPRRCAVLVPICGQIAGQCDKALKELERRGYTVRRIPTHTALDAARNRLATVALIEGFEETLWIDSSVAFDPGDVERLRAHRLPICCVLFPVKGRQRLLGQVNDAQSRLAAHGGQSLLELRNAAAGLLHVRREVYERMQCELALPLCDEATPHLTVPFFQPLVYEGVEGYSYLPDDWSFCERARRCGFSILADPSIRLVFGGIAQAESSKSEKRTALSAGPSANASSATNAAAEPTSACQDDEDSRMESGTSHAMTTFTPCPANRCAILVPVADHIEPACEASLRELERRDYPVWRVHGYKQVDLARCQMASDALAAGCEETLWIDADTGFHPDMVDRLRSHSFPIACGIYAKKSKRELAIHAMPGTKQILFGAHGGPLEILYAPTGFLLVRRQVYTKMREQLALPECRADTGRTLVPYYAPLIRPDGDGWWYLAEDFSFCERARQCGFKIMADTSIRLLHIGKYAYGWEDAGRQVQRYSSFKFNLKDAEDKKAAERVGEPTAQKPRG